MIFVVSYTLNPPRANLPLIIELQQSPDWAHYLDTTWLVATNENAGELYERLRGHFAKSDSLLIVEVRAAAQYFGWLPRDAWNWLAQRTAPWVR